MKITVRLLPKVFLYNEEGEQCLINNTSYGINGGAVVLNQYGSNEADKRVAIWQYVYGSASEEGEETEDTGAQDRISYLVSHGIYTHLVVEKDKDDPFITYIEDTDGKKYFYVHYWIREKNGSNPLKKEVQTYFRVANE